MSEKMFGYNGKIAYINLSNEIVENKDLDPKIAQFYLGGTGLSAKIVYDLLKDEDYNVLRDNPFNEINPLVFATGPVTGTLRPSSGRYSVSGISPLTGIWGEGTSGGFFCTSLHRSGFDSIVITSKANKPIYLYIHDEIVEFKDANNVWGKNTYETQELIKQELNNDKVKIACIGAAGENLVKYAAIINDEGRAQGRCGLGAIMGSKNLQALAIHGTKRIEVYDIEKMKTVRKLVEDEAKSNLIKMAGPALYNLFGTNGYLDLGMAQGDTPAYYFTETEFPADKLVGKTIKETFPQFGYGCAGCTLRCGKVTLIEVGNKDIEVDGPEYESVACYGPMLGLFDPKPVILAHHICNELGIDTISSGVSISFLLYLVQNNLAVAQIKNYLNDIKIEDIKWGNSDLILKLINKIANREGIGDLLAEGVRYMAEKLGIDPELAAHVKGLEIPMHDPRAFAGQALNYMTSCIGASHEKADWFMVEIKMVEETKLRIKTGDRFDITKRERGVVALQDIRAIDDAAVNCNVMGPSFDHVVDFINAATGFNYNRKGLIRVGERINNIKRLINCNLGITRDDDKLPAIVLKPLKTGGSSGVKLDLEDNLKVYYKNRGWDWETGRPTDEKLKDLGII